MYIKRKIDNELANWRNEANRKPLLIRGARQVGKTKTIREFATGFENFIEVNFEETPGLKTLFDGDFDPLKICSDLSVIKNTDIMPGKTLLFFDEIQACPNALMSLRFFYEKFPELHVIAAGSLLEFTLQEIPTFGVGRIRSLFLSPLSFSEFLDGIGEHKLGEAVRQAGPQKPLHEIVHNRLNELVRRFIILGGMPEVVAAYAESGDMRRCQTLLDDLIISFQADFAKYTGREPVSRLQEVFQSVVYQAGKKFMLTKAATQANTKQVRSALQLLITAGLVIPVTHSAANGLPLGAEINPQKQKMLLFDTGIFQRLLNLDLGEYMLSGDFTAINKGSVAEQFVGLELVKAGSPYQMPALYYWHREAKNSSAEVDYVIVAQNAIVPVEVKAGTKGAMQSLFLFLQEKNLSKGIRVSSENFSSYSQVAVYPLYAIGNIING